MGFSINRQPESVTAMTSNSQVSESKEAENQYAMRVIMTEENQDTIAHNQATAVPVQARRETPLSKRSANVRRVMSKEGADSGTSDKLITKSIKDLEHQFGERKYSDELDHEELAHLLDQLLAKNSKGEASPEEIIDMVSQFTNNDPYLAHDVFRFLGNSILDKGNNALAQKISAAFDRYAEEFQTEIQIGRNVTSVAKTFDLSTKDLRGWYTNFMISQTREISPSDLYDAMKQSFGSNKQEATEKLSKLRTYLLAALGEDLRKRDIDPVEMRDKATQARVFQALAQVFRGASASTRVVVSALELMKRRGH